MRPSLLDVLIVHNQVPELHNYWTLLNLDEIDEIRVSQFAGPKVWLLFNSTASMFHLLPNQITSICHPWVSAYLGIPSSSASIQIIIWVSTSECDYWSFMFISSPFGIISSSLLRVKLGFPLLSNMRVSIVMGVPNSWMVFVRENPNLKWMMTRATPMTLETPIW